MRFSPITLFIAILLFINSDIVYGQVTPTNRSTINYRLTGFSAPEKKDVTAYEFVVNKLIITDTGETVEEHVFTRKSSTNKIVELLPEFGTTYTWKINYYKGEELLESSQLYRFATGYDKLVDPEYNRLRILHNDGTNNEMAIFIDAMKVLYNNKGEALWYLPNITGKVDNTKRIRDLKVTPQNTITFLTDDNAYEIDYAGNILWEGPNTGDISGDSIEQYHHEFTRLANGNYMVAGRDISLRKIPGEIDESIYKDEVDIIIKKNKYYKKIYSGTIIEYDTAGNVIWTWRSSDYLTDKDLFNKQNQSGTVKAHPHMNSFFFDKKHNVIYTGYRDINRIIKIAYPSGEVLAQYGENYTDEGVYPVDEFKSHHHNSITSNGNILLYNNNVADAEDRVEGRTISSLQVYKEITAEKKGLKLLWEFSCDIDTLTPKFNLTGGSVYELSDDRYLGCMGSVNRVFVVSKNEQILWNALHETNSGDKWTQTGGYRAFAIEKEETLRNIIFNVTHIDSRN